MIKTLQRRFALSRQGAVDLIKGCIALCGKRGKAYILSGTATQNPVVLFWQKRPCGFNQFYYGRLCYA